MNKLLHGTCYYPELWPESEIDRAIAGMKFLGLNMVRLGEFTWSKLEPDEGLVSADFFVRVLDKLHAAGLQLGKVRDGTYCGSGRAAREG